MKDFKNLLFLLISLFFCVAVLNGGGNMALDYGARIVPGESNLRDHPYSSGVSLASRQGAVLWDTTHGVASNYWPWVRYSDLLTMLVDSGFTIDVDGSGVNNVNLLVYDVIVIGLGTSWLSVYTQEEVDSLVSYYNQGNQRIILTSDMNFCGNDYFTYADNIPFTYNVFEWLSASGGIFLMSDNTNCPNQYIRPVAQAFNMDVGISYPTPYDLYFTNFAAHPIFSGVSQIYYRAAGEVSAAAPAQILAWTDAGEPTIGVMDEAIGIELIEFTAHSTENGILLRWLVGCEIDIMEWLIERKEGENCWKLIARIPSKGNSPSGRTYSFVDSGVEMGRLHDYRLGCTDGMGNLEWLGFLTAEFDHLQALVQPLITGSVPNPCAARSVVSFWLPEHAHTTLMVYDMLGRGVDILVDDELPRGAHTAIFKGEKLSSGIYYVVLRAGDDTSTKRCILLK